MRATIPKTEILIWITGFLEKFLLVLQECDNRWLYLPAIKYDFKVLGCKNLIKSTGCVFTSHTNHLVYDFLFSLMQLNFTPVAKKISIIPKLSLKISWEGMNETFVYKCACGLALFFVQFFVLLIYYCNLIKGNNTAPAVTPAEH